ncbi:recombinase family protein [bacterium]|nr:recombinase family protein [bacterium]MDY3023486.1 recombinase family protein [Oliverpabstia sp.]
MLRAVVYARCSTEEESQKDALEKQVAEAKECVIKNGWLLIDVYVESRSGTTTKGRKEYNRLFEDMPQEKFDIIVIKSQDRLMRNTKDWYLFVDRLTTNHKKLYMYIEHKFYSADDALITGIKAILAEDYSRELSKKINNAHRGRQKHNGNVILTSNVYGLRKLPDKSIELIEEEAKVKERMYILCAEGFGTRTIATILKNEGVLNRSGKPFEATSILRMIRNPLNKGTVVMNRKHFDFDTKRTINVPAEEQYVYENKVPRIVSDELWEKANAQIDKRTADKNKPDEKTRGKNQGKYPLSGKIVCGLCGKPYYRRMRKRYKDKVSIYEWKCKSYLDTGRNTGKLNRPQLRKVQLDNVEGCDNIHLNEDAFNEFLENSLKNNYDIDKKKIMNDMLTLLKKTLKENDIQPKIDVQISLKKKVELQMNMLVNKLLDGIIDDSLYKNKQKQLEKELQTMQDKIKELELKKAKESALEERIAHIEKVIIEKNIVEKSTVNMMLNEIDKITIYPTYMEIEFSCSKILGIDNYDITDKQDKIRIEYGNLFNYRQQQRDDLQMIVECMKKKPTTTAKEIAKECGITTSGVQQRITRLRKAGRVHFVGKAGKGHWEVLKE